MAEKACHVFTSTTRFGLTQALGGIGMFWLFLVIAAVAAAFAVYLENIWIVGACLLAIVAAVWDGRSKGMWHAHEFEELDSGGSSDSGSDGGGDGGGGGD